MKWILLSFVATVMGAGFAFEKDTIFQQPKSKNTQPHPGKKVYDEYCLACHQADGRGVPGMNPPITPNDWVQGDKIRLIGVILNGLDEPIEINGESYQNVMPAHDFLTDQQVADVLTYVRSNFGNKADAVKLEEVVKVRSAKK